MSSNFTITIPKPCHENWQTFTPTAKGGFCAACQKEVIDFTSWTDEEIKEFFKTKTETCGKFKSAQLKKYNDSKPSPLAWRLAAILTLVSLWFGRPGIAQTGQKSEYELVERNRDTLKADTVIAKLVIIGKVKDQEGIEMPGVNVIVKGTILGTVSDGDGKFMLQIDKPRYAETLVFNFIGMIGKEMTVIASAPQKELEVKLEYDQVALGEEITVGGVRAVGRFSPRRLWWGLKRIFSKG